MAASLAVQVHVVRAVASLDHQLSQPARGLEGTGPHQPSDALQQGFSHVVEVVARCQTALMQVCVKMCMCLCVVYSSEGMHVCVHVCACVCVCSSECMQVCMQMHVCALVYSK